MHKAYSDDCQGNIIFPGTLIGLERDLYINSEIAPHKVKVIGETQDSNDKGLTSLTFQFSNLISGNDKKVIYSYWNSINTNVNYWSSDLCNNLNGIDNAVWYDSNNQEIVGLTSSVYQMIINDQHNESLAKEDGIKDVTRGVNVYDENIIQETKYRIDYRTTKLFEPTLSNLFSVRGITDNKSQITDHQQQVLYCNEGQKNITVRQYAYYAQYISDNPFDWSTTYDSLIRKDCTNTDPDWYWLSSPGFLFPELKNRACYVNYNASVRNFYASLKCGLAPCFCI